MLKLGLLVAMLAGGLAAQTTFSSPPNLANSNTLPATCKVGDVYFKANATAGQNLNLCTATNIWTQVNSATGTVTSSGSPSSGNIPKFTTATNVAPAAASDVSALWSGGTNCGTTTNALLVNGNCATPSGSLASIATNTFLGNPTNATAVPVAMGLGFGLGWCGTTPNILPCLNTAVGQSNAGDTANYCKYLASTTGNTTYVASLASGCAALTAYTTGSEFLLNVDTTCSSSCTLNIDSLGAKAIKKKDCSTDPGGVLVASQPQNVWYNGSVVCLLYN